MKKILFCNNNLSGLLGFRGEVVNNFISQGFSIIFIVPKHESNRIYLSSISPEIKLIEVTMDRTDTGLFSNLKYGFSLWKIYRKEKPDFIFHYTIKPNVFGSIVAKMLSIPSVAMMAGLGVVFSDSSFKHIIAKILYKIGLACSEKVIVLNQDNYETVLAGKFCKKDKLILMNGEGVDLNRYHFTNNKSKRTIFLLVCRILKEKGYYEFVKAAERIKSKYSNVEFDIVGMFDLAHKNAISKEQVNSDVNNGYIKYLGSFTNMMDVYNKPGIVLTLPSFYFEGLNRTLMEACACGKPIITTNIPGCKETVIDGVNGYLCAPKNVDSLVCAMEKYLALDFTAKEEMSRESRKLAVSKFDVNEVIETYNSIIKVYL